MNLKGQVALVVGGAGSIGAATADLLSELGATVIVCDIDEKRIDHVRAKLQTADRRIFFHELDALDEFSASSVVRAAESDHGQIDILVYLVGGTTSQGLLNTSSGEIRQDIDRNLTSALLWAKSVLPVMLAKKHGSMIFCSSVNASLGGFGQPSYACAKAGLEALVRSLTGEYSRSGIRFNAVVLGSIPGDLPRWENRFTKNPELKSKLIEMYPLGRLGRPEDAAAAIAFLAGSWSSWVSGISLPVDGGVSAAGGIREFTW